jgi:hypothetical protein
VRLGVAVLIALAGGAGCRRIPDATLERTNDAKDLLINLRFQLARAFDASDRAVMADTDEASIAYAREADLAKAAIEASAARLSSQLESLGYHRESRSLDEFRARFTEYGKVDRDVLELAVENTNLKAQRLSFGPVREAADALRDALRASLTTVAERDRCKAENLVANAVVAVREIQVLQAPHIAAAEDTAMTRLEKEMSDRQDATARAVTALAALPGAGNAAIADARGDLERLGGLSRQLVALSRRNTNVRSLDVSLHQTPALRAACETTLAALTDALSKEGSSATR